MTEAKLYRKPNTNLRIYAVEEHGDIRLTKFTKDHANIASLKVLNRNLKLFKKNLREANKSYYLLLLVLHPK